MTHLRLRLIISAGVFFLFLFPVLATHYICDEGAYAYPAQAMTWLEGVSTAKMLYQGMMSWNATGRFFPLALFWEFLPHAFMKCAAFKATVVATTVLGHFAFYWALRELGLTAAVALLTVIVTGTTAQLREFFDPLTGIGIQFQMLVVQLFASIALLARYLRHGRRGEYAASVTLLFACCLTYEIAYAFLCMHALLVLRARRHPALIAPFAVATAIPILIALWFRFHATEIYDGVQFGHSISGYFTLLAKQSFAALPLSHLRAAPLQWNPRLPLLAVCALLGLGTIALTFAPFEQGDRPARFDYAFAALLWISPAIVFSLSGTYQASVQWGVGYVPVFVQSYGAGLLVSLLLVELGRLVRPAVPALIAGAACALTFYQNYPIFEYYYDYARPMVEMTSAVEGGLLADARDGETVTVRGGGVYQPHYFMVRAMKRLRYTPWREAKQVDRQPMILISAKIEGRVVTHVALWIDDRDGDFVHVRKLRSAVTGSAPEKTAALFIDRDGKGHGIGPHDALPAEGVWARISSVQAFDRKTALATLWAGGFSGDEGGGFRWSDKHGTLCLWNGDRESHFFDVRASFYSPDGGMLLNGLKIAKNAGDARMPWQSRLSLAPGANCLHFSTDGSKVIAPTDPRSLYFQIAELKVVRADVR